MTSFRWFLLAILVAVLAPRAADAQLCRGLPFGDGHVLAAGEARKTAGSLAFGGTAGVSGADATGLLNYADVALDGHGPHATQIGFGFVYGDELCWTVGLFHTWFHELHTGGTRTGEVFNVTTFEVSGIAAAKAFPIAKQLVVAPFATWDFTITRNDLVVYSRTSQHPLDDVSYDAPIAVGASLRLWHFFLRGSAHFTNPFGTISGEDPGWSLRVALGGEL